MNSPFPAGPEDSPVSLDQEGVWDKAIQALKGIDVPLDVLMARYDRPTWTEAGSAFQTLARAITGQQISVRAADSLWKRFCALGAVEPAAVRDLSLEELRQCGYSSRKVDYLKELARHFSTGLVTEAELRAASDAQVYALLTRVHGIGRWSAEMFLIFYLRRPDVFPVADLGLQRALRLHFSGLKEAPVPDLVSYAERWRPWRSVVTWVLWRSLDPVEVIY
ncbi:DNA-3-methyladenine glycosylase II [mine drainage metagenome]|uniref:DNA-3-methyladenine glycosylase II n=1 Tax=mine drainage metagenome TaxID=410659 RepID=T1CMG6_9ZZZZ